MLPGGGNPADVLDLVTGRFNRRVEPFRDPAAVKRAIPDPLELFAESPAVHRLAAPLLEASPLAGIVGAAQGLQVGGPQFADRLAEVTEGKWWIVRAQEVQRDEEEQQVGGITDPGLPSQLTLD